MLCGVRGSTEEGRLTQETVCRGGQAGAGLGGFHVNGKDRTGCPRQRRLQPQACSAGGVWETPSTSVRLVHRCLLRCDEHEDGGVGRA